MWLWHSTPGSRQAWLASLDAVAALKPSTIITGHKDPGAPDNNATRVLDHSRRYIEDFDQTVAKSSTPREVTERASSRNRQNVPCRKLPTSRLCGIYACHGVGRLTGWLLTSAS